MSHKLLINSIFKNEVKAGITLVTTFRPRQLDAFQHHVKNWLCLWYCVHFGHLFHFILFQTGSLIEIRMSFFKSAQK